MTDEQKSKDHAVVPDVQKRLEELFADSPLNDEPLTAAQKAFMDRLMRRKPKLRTRRRDLARLRPLN
jgi:predicted aminopeptidase